MSWFKTNIKMLLVIVGFALVVALLISGINISNEANATATANAKAIATSIAKSNAVSKSVSNAEASATNNTYFINHKHKGLVWKYNTHTNVFAEKCTGYDILSICFLGYWKIDSVNPHIIELYSYFPLPWMQRFWIVGDTLYVGYFEKKKK